MKQLLNLPVNTITIGARASPLSKAQVQEVLATLQTVDSSIQFEPTWIETTGDLDLHTSLRTLAKNDFFTREIDASQLQGHFRISIHSAKDLPQVLPCGLELVALTKGIDRNDVVVLRDGETLTSLKSGAKIATSSLRRMAAIQELRSDLECVDIRGTIEERLAKLDNHEVDGVVFAKAALIRLKLTNLNEIPLPGTPARYQGQLAVLAAHDDKEMQELFRPLNTAKSMYTGLDSRAFFEHYPLIETKPLHPTISKDILASITHIIFTSKTAVRYFPYLELLKNKIVISVGMQTSHYLLEQGFKHILTATSETTEGIIEVLQTLPLQSAHFLWAHSAKSRDDISNFLYENNSMFTEVVLYDTVTRKMNPLPQLDQFDMVYFTSPSTVDACIDLYGSIPHDLLVTAIGPATHTHVQDILSNSKPRG